MFLYFDFFLWNDLNYLILLFFLVCDLFDFVKENIFLMILEEDENDDEE